VYGGQVLKIVTFNVEQGNYSGEQLNGSHTKQLEAYISNIATHHEPHIVFTQEDTSIVQQWGSNYAEWHRSPTHKGYVSKMCNCVFAQKSFCVEKVAHGVLDLTPGIQDLPEDHDDASYKPRTMTWMIVKDLSSPDYLFVGSFHLSGGRFDDYYCLGDTEVRDIKRRQLQMAADCAHSECKLLPGRRIVILGGDTNGFDEAVVESFQKHYATSMLKQMCLVSAEQRDAFYQYQTIPGTIVAGGPSNRLLLTRPLLANQHISHTTKFGGAVDHFFVGMFESAQFV